MSSFNQIGVLLMVYLMLAVFGNNFGLTMTTDFFHIKQYSWQDKTNSVFVVDLITNPVGTIINGLMATPIGSMFILIINISTLPFSILISNLPEIVKIPLEILAILTIIAMYNAIIPGK